MKTTVEKIAGNLKLTAKANVIALESGKLRVIREGLFGANEFVVGKYHFEKKNRFYWKRWSPQDWWMKIGDKPAVRIPYKYVICLIYIQLGLIETKKIYAWYTATY